MSRIRSMHPGIFTDEAWAAVSIPARWLAMGLTTEADDNGIFEWKPLQIKMRIYPADNVDVPNLLAELEQQQIVKQFTAEGKQYGAVKNFCRYQRPRKPKAWHPMPDELHNFVSLGGGTSEHENDESGAVPQKSEPSQPKTQAVLPKSEKSPQMEDGGGRMEEENIRRKAPRRISYPPRFLVFWSTYPSDPGMSKSEALGEWQKLGEDDQNSAIASMPAFKVWLSKQPSDYRIIHACRFLKKRRFDGFVADAEQLAEMDARAASQVYVAYGTEAGDAWERYWRLTRGGAPPRDKAGKGWYFPTEFPEADVARETSGADA